MKTILVLVALWVAQNGLAQDTSDRILILGDSHCVGGFCDALHESFASLQKFSVSSVGICAASFETFFMKPPTTFCGHKERTSDPSAAKAQVLLEYPRKSTARSLDTILEAFRPTIVITEVGMNYGDYAVESIVASTTRFSEYLQNHGIKKLFIIGPPNYPKVGPIEEAFRRTVATTQFGEYVTSVDFNRHTPLTTHGFHFSMNQARKWGIHAFAKLKPMIDPDPAPMDVLGVAVPK